MPEKKQFFILLTLLFCFIFFQRSYASTELESSKLTNFKPPLIDNWKKPCQESISFIGEKKYQERVKYFEKIAKSACSTAKKSKKHADVALRNFRITGILITILSALIPLLAAYDKTKAVFLPIVSVLVAALSGINSFYNFQGSWAKSRAAQYHLGFRIEEWRDGVSKALLQPNQEDQIKTMEISTKLLLKDYEASVMKTAEGYFNQSYKLPEKTKLKE